MILYNVTVKVDLSIRKEWLKWMQETHIPEVMATGYFQEYRFLHLLEQDESDGMTYAIQYFCDSMENYRKYAEKEAPVLQEKHSQKFKDRFVAFRTLLEVIE